MTRSDLIARILNGLNESPTASVFWSSAQVAQAIQDGQEVLAEEAAAIKRTAFTALRPGSTYYATRGIAPDLMAVTRIWIPSLNRRLTAVTVSQLDAFHERWQTVTGDPEYWAPMGWDWFALYPHPAAGGGTLRVDYTAWPRTLLDDDDEPETLLADHDGLVLYGVYEGLLKRWNADQATVLWALFLEKLGKGQARSGNRQLQARAWGRSTASAPFRSGVGDRRG